MKKILVYLVLIVGIFSFNYTVDALDYQEKELIPIDAVATVRTELFTYQDFRINISSDGKGNIIFNSIINNSDKRVPVSINLLLFDENEKNIGYLTYCTDRDLSSDNTYFKLSPNGKAPFTINVAKKYFVDGKTINDVMFIAVMDENKYCHVGGYDKYNGLTIKDIRSEKVAADFDRKVTKINLFSLLKNKALYIVVLFIVALILIIVVNGLILNALYKRMFAATTPMAYIPMLCNYVAVKLSFGELISKVYLVLLFISLPLSFIGFGVLRILVTFVTAIASLVVVVKLITKRYDLFYYEPTVKNTVKEAAGGLSVNVGSNDNSFVSSEYVSDADNLNQDNISRDDVVDLSYDSVSSDVDIGDNILGNLGNDGQTGISNISAGGSSLGDSFGDMSEGSETSDNSQNTDSNEGESDLSKFFR